MAGKNGEQLLAVLRAALQPYLAGDVLLLVGFSGGRDSLSLLWGLKQLADTDLAGCYRLVAAHFNHNLRGEEATADEQFCRDFCRENGIEFCAAVAQNLSPDMPNLEQAARVARYAWFNTLRQQYEAQGLVPYLLTAHHLEDQAETVLLHMLRGSGTAGLAAMRAQSSWQLRPMLNLPRCVAQAALQEAGLGWRDDSTNSSLLYTRNYVRAKVMPALKKVNPRAEQAIAQVAQIAAAEEDYFAALLAEKLQRAELTSGRAVYVWADFAAEPLAIRRRLVRALWQAVTNRPVCPLTLAQTDAVIALAAGQSVNLSGAVLAARRGKKLIFSMPTAEALQRRQQKSRSGQKRAAGAKG